MRDSQNISDLTSASVNTPEAQNVSPAAQPSLRPQQTGTMFRSFGQDLVGLGATVLAGISGAWWSVDGSFWKNAKEKKDDLIGTLSKDRDSARRNTFKTLHNAIDTNAPAAEIKKIASETAQKIGEIEKDYMRAKKTLLKNMQLSTAIRRFGTLRIHQKQEALTAGIATAAIALGVVTSLAAFQRSGKMESDLAADLESRDSQTR